MSIIKISKYYYYFLSVFYCQYLFCKGDPIRGHNIEQAAENSFPFVVSISSPNLAGIENKEKYHICGGALITRKHVLTSAHCKIDVKYVSDVVIEVGSTDLRKAEHYKIKCWTPYNAWAKKHNRYTEGEENDISIIKLSKKVSPDIVLGVISSEKTESFYGKHATTVGWGVTNDYKLSQHLIKAELDILSKGKCMSEMKRTGLFERKQITSLRYLCTESIPPSILECGDGGGPLIVNGTEIIGINDSVCAIEEGQREPKEFNLHLGLDFYRDFIDDLTKKKSAWAICQ